MEKIPKPIEMGNFLQELFSLQKQLPGCSLTSFLPSVENLVVQPLEFYSNFQLTVFLIQSLTMNHCWVPHPHIQSQQGCLALSTLCLPGGEEQSDHCPRLLFPPT